MPTPRPAIVLLSGGLDSATCLAIARAERYAPLYSLSFDYGQRHRHELVGACQVSRAMGVKEHRVIRIDLRQFGKSALTDDIAVPKDRSDGEMSGEVPITYVPARNTIFLSYALAWAEVLGVMDVFIGVNAVDYSGYPDCRPEFIEAFERVGNLGTKMGIEGTEARSHGGTEGGEEGQRFRVHAPLIQLTKAEIIRRGVELGVDYSMTHSCYDPDESGAACGHCDSCIIRRKGFMDARVKDPTRYRAG